MGIIILIAFLQRAAKLLGIMEVETKKALPFHEQKQQQLQMLIYLIPVIGVFPAFWSLYRHQGRRNHQRVSRLSVTLAFGWLLAYSLLWAGAASTSDLLTVRLLYLNGLLTSGYFLTCFWLALRLWQGKLPQLPRIS